MDRILHIGPVHRSFLSARHHHLEPPWKSEDDYIMYNEKEATERYVGTLSKGPNWFWVDLLSIVPYKTMDLIPNASNLTGLGASKNLRVLKMAKLVRVFKGVKVYLRAEKIVARKVGYSTLRLVVFFFVLVFISHILSCGLYVVYKMGKYNGEYLGYMHMMKPTFISLTTRNVLQKCI